MLDPIRLKPGKEQYEEYTSTLTEKTLIQYDYRDEDGELFSTITRTLEEARAQKDLWLKKGNMK